jgi:hypothetical protein
VISEAVSNLRAMMDAKIVEKVTDDVIGDAVTKLRATEEETKR